MNTMVSAASLATAMPIAAAVPTTAPAMPATDSRPDASLARAEEIVSLLRTCYIRERWKIDEAAAERALAYCRGYAADGSDPDDEREAAFDFFRSHGQSLDWVFDGRHSALICRLAAHSKRANSMADAELRRLADEYIRAEQKSCDLTTLIDQMDGQLVDLPESLRILPSDLELGRKPWQSDDEFWHRPCDLDQWRKLEKMELESQSETDDRLEYAFRKVRPSEELRLRADEIVTAYDKWRAERKRPRGYKKAVRENEKAERAYMRIEGQIAEMRATTFEGMLAKVRCAQAYAKSQEIKNIDGGAATEAMALSIFEDLLQLGKPASA